MTGKKTEIDAFLGTGMGWVIEAQSRTEFLLERLTANLLQDDQESPLAGENFAGSSGDAAPDSESDKPASDTVADHGGKTTALSIETGGAHLTSGDLPHAVDAPAGHAEMAKAFTIEDAAKIHRLLGTWSNTSRSEQRPPEGDWRVWLLMGGRGSGKTRAGAEWVHGLASGEGARPGLRIALLAETLGDAREVMIDGVSGICRIARQHRPDFEASRRRLVWPNGTVAQIFSSEDPESLRGPQFDYAWCDDLQCSISCTLVNLR